MAVGKLMILVTIGGGCFRGIVINQDVPYGVIVKDFDDLDVYPESVTDYLDNYADDPDITGRFRVEVMDGIDEPERDQNKMESPVQKDNTSVYVICQNCSHVCELLSLEHQYPNIPHLYERVDIGEPTPAGECPKCGALMHPYKKVL
jgi:hypothetical protein